ncbi:uncharacterized protein N7518_006948 [Penicillium psychrosexuale]|uniref:uncharacterized protein n=1 Tax=Penicillium psychrosexuale TaxID=1002107 RepID=UPI00254513FD|nr:uncharacterized protein N7518_006948 [Penicillium psychrosexuale]KAJ5789937.1 hypothetical protein N7518_006948 [Penicillium psychrosexuale]
MADEALMQYLFHDDIWEAIDTDINDTETRRDSRNGIENENGNGRQGEERELKLSNGTGENHEEGLKQHSGG